VALAIRTLGFGGLSHPGRRSGSDPERTCNEVATAAVRGLTPLALTATGARPRGAGVWPQTATSSREG